MSKFRHFWQYWRENIKTAKGGYDMGYLIISIVLLVVSQIVGSVNPMLADIAKWSGIIIASGWCLLWLPYHRHLQREVKVIAEKAELKKEVEKLQHEFDDKKLFKLVDERLGDFRQALENRVYEIDESGYYGYADKYQPSFNQQVLDPDSQHLVNQVEKFLKLTVGGSSPAIFLDVTNVKRTPMELPLDTKLRYKQSAIDVLNHRINQLTSIIEQYVEHKGVMKY